MNAIPLQRDDDFYYPESDGQPMDSDLHLDEMADLIRALRRRYRDVPDVYVTGNLFFYYVKGDPRSVVAPDVFLVCGVAKRKRRTYKLWEEGRIPSLVIELTSDSTKDEDLSKKKLCYESLGVEEYFLHDPFGDYLDPTLQGFRLVNGRYRPVEAEPDGSLRSLTTGLILQVEGTRLRLVDAVTGERLLWDDELDEKVEATERRAAALEEELARLRRKLAEGA
jgi:Uma2 family endonuclease